jgi:hypothetical protein
MLIVFVFPLRIITGALTSHAYLLISNHRSYKGIDPFLFVNYESVAVLPSYSNNGVFLGSNITCHSRLWPFAGKYKSLYETASYIAQQETSCARPIRSIY